MSFVQLVSQLTWPNHPTVVKKSKMSNMYLNRWIERRFGVLERQWTDLPLVVERDYTLAVDVMLLMHYDYDAVDVD